MITDGLDAEKKQVIYDAGVAAGNTVAAWQPGDAKTIGKAYLRNARNNLLAEAQKQLLQQAGFSPQGSLWQCWTILDEAGARAVAFDFFMNMDVRGNAKVISAPVEEGGFVSYNKINAPLEIGLQLGFKGAPAEVQRKLDQLQGFLDSTALVSVVTPEQEYKSMNLTKLAFNRGPDKGGIDIVYVDCGFTEVRQVATQYSSARLAPRRNNGRQQGKNVSAAAGLRDWVKGFLK